MFCFQYSELISVGGIRIGTELSLSYSVIAILAIRELLLRIAKIVAGDLILDSGSRV